MLRFHFPCPAGFLSGRVIPRRVPMIRPRSCAPAHLRVRPRRRITARRRGLDLLMVNGPQSLANRDRVRGSPAVAESTPAPRATRPWRLLGPVCLPAPNYNRDLASSGGSCQAVNTAEGVFVGRTSIANWRRAAQATPPPAFPTLQKSRQRACLGRRNHRGGRRVKPRKRGSFASLRPSG